MQQPQVFFSDAEPGQRFNIFYPAQSNTPRGTIVYVHPFAEEMNKSRRMAAVTARRLAQAGFGVLQVDLHGCGDSSGDFGDASWSNWVQDVVQASQHALRLSPAPLWLWGLRAGCLVASEAARHLDVAANFIFWAPPSNGSLLLQQFLRLKLAGDMVSGGAKGGMEALRQQLASDQAVEIAGYQLAPALANGLGAATLAAPRQTGHLLWLEISNKPDATLSPASNKTIATWQNAGVQVHSEIVPGPAFWQTSEIELAPALEEATLSAIRQTLLPEVAT
ncbi:hydrolase 2, exosortase A system-associated [Variovorax sp. HJSM1_2]|uniref:hydrolase 2, exosortase A system-associated n=1 Tax=Variovorax sp. HJSM1_2 TaxID=3366263 RepID=UPI003BCD5B31